MEIKPARLQGVHTLSSVKRGDERGYLIRTHCSDAFAGAGLNDRWMQSSITCSALQGTLRGMHFQTEPFGEIKLIRCVTGAVWDCLVDIRPGSPTYGQWEAFELSEENGAALYVPEGIAHGFYTLTPEVRMLYSMSAPYSAPHASGIRWDDPDLAIPWPGAPTVLSERDASWPTLSGR
ncbi:MAG: dTDP-4-keto-6-deoxy-D-glucose epimerase [Verrucomicrobiaceae bacterium]|nr:MAG: dTDP-4-keto-6-deoxy-D-glucose epimerase [Verrucomicrobiaceae bacterium]